MVGQGFFCVVFFFQGLLTISSNLQAPACASATISMCWLVKPSPTPGRNTLISHCECEEGLGSHGSVLKTNILCLLCNENISFHFDFC